MDAAPPSDPPRGAAWRLALAVAAVGLVAAAFSIGFRLSLRAVLGVVAAPDLVAAMRAAPWPVRLGLPAVGGLGAGLIGLVVARMRGGGGVGYVMEAVALGTVRLPVRRTLLQSLASWLAIASGNSIGREGPIIQLGASAGEAARRVFSLDDTQARVAIAAGVAAGFTAAYNTPLAAALFVVEIVAGVAVVEALAPVLLATVVATVVTRVVGGGGPLYGARAFAAPDALALVALAALGLVAAPVGVGCVKLLGLAERGWRRLPMPWRPALGGLVCGAILVGVPAVAGNGLEPLLDVLDGKVPLAMLALLLVAKPLATIASVGSGNPGGVFTPTLLVGACLGLLCAAGLDATVGLPASTGSFALVGLAATLAATTHAPLMSAVLAVELAGDYALVLPLVAATAIAAALARWMDPDSIYTAELRQRGVPWRLTLDGRR